MSGVAWSEISSESSIYADLRSFLSKTRTLDKAETSGRLKIEFKKALIAGKRDLALLWLNEYQLINSIDSWSADYERILAPLYNAALGRKFPLRFFQADHLATEVLKFLKKKCAGERCFIIGNGPSLNALDLAKLKNEFTFGVNCIFLAREKMGFPTTFYCVEDTHVANDRRREIQAVDSPFKFFGHYLKNAVMEHPNNVFLNIIMDYRPYTGFPFFSVDASRRIWVGGTVSYINMQLAYHMGFKEVYLVGFDHEYKICESAVVSGYDIRSNENDPNHFHPDYFGPGYNWHIPLVNRMELGYIKAKRAFELDGREIVNLTPGGRLEVFRRADYEAILARPRPSNKRDLSDVYEYAGFRLARLNPDLTCKKPSLVAMARNLLDKPGYYLKKIEYRSKVMIYYLIFQMRSFPLNVKKFLNDPGYYTKTIITRLSTQIFRKFRR